MLTDNEQALLEKNEKMLAIPAAKFILFYGCLLFGLLTSILVLVATKLMGGNVSRANIITTFVAFIAGGALYGMLMRKGIERNRERLLKKKQDASG